ncbi:MAG: glycerol-3-phosphate responsive antiterminator [Ruminococcaceae bacterium]|nr:glycerol-3-phosphate responsive antiterminator [Oscillospiraceae bacterium]
MIIAAVKNTEELQQALASSVSLIVHMTPNINTITQEIQMVHEQKRKMFLHIDLSEGIGKDKHGILFLKGLGVDGIISTRTNLIRAAKEEGMITIQRFFIVDSHSVDTTVESLKVSKADMIEVMPGVAPKIIQLLKKRVNVPIIAGGLIDTEEEIKQAMNHGAAAISTGKKHLWRL